MKITLVCAIRFLDECVEAELGIEVPSLLPVGTEFTRIERDGLLEFALERYEVSLPAVDDDAETPVEIYACSRTDWDYSEHTREDFLQSIKAFEANGWRIVNRDDVPLYAVPSLDAFSLAEG